MGQGDEFWMTQILAHRIPRYPQRDRYLLDRFPLTCHLMYRIHYTAPHHGRLLCELRTLTHTAYSQLGGRSILSGRPLVNYILSLIPPKLAGFWKIVSLDRVTVYSSSLLVGSSLTRNRAMLPYPHTMGMAIASRGEKLTRLTHQAPCAKNAKAMHSLPLQRADASLPAMFSLPYHVQGCMQ